MSTDTRHGLVMALGLGFVLSGVYLMAGVGAMLLTVGVLIVATVVRIRTRIEHVRESD